MELGNRDRKGGQKGNAYLKLDLEVYGVRKLQWPVGMGGHDQFGTASAAGGGGFVFVKVKMGLLSGSSQ